MSESDSLRSPGRSAGKHDRGICIGIMWNSGEPIEEERREQCGEHCDDLVLLGDFSRKQTG